MHVLSFAAVLSHHGIVTCGWILQLDLWSILVFQRFLTPELAISCNLVIEKKKSIILVQQYLSYLTTNRSGGHMQYFHCNTLTCAPAFATAASFCAHQGKHPCAASLTDSTSFQLDVIYFGTSPICNFGGWLLGSKKLPITIYCQIPANFIVKQWTFIVVSF